MDNFETVMTTLWMLNCLVHHQCGIDVVVCLSSSLVYLCDLCLLLQPAFIPSWPFSGPPHIPGEDALPMWSFVFVLVYSLFIHLQ